MNKVIIGLVVIFIQILVQIVEIAGKILQVE